MSRDFEPLPLTEFRVVPVVEDAPARWSAQDIRFECNALRWSRGDRACLIKCDDGKVYERKAWTGGDVGTPEWCDVDLGFLARAYLNEQIADFRHGSGTSPDDTTLATFINRANLDAWRTLSEHRKPLVEAA